MKKKIRPEDFIQKPKYIGNWATFLKENLKYPAKAIEHEIEGFVHLSYEVNGNGKVRRAKITKSLGYGCDEEALRLVKMMKYESVSNRNLKINTHHKIKIEFKLPEIQSYKYTLSTSVKKAAKKNHPPKKVKPRSYTYTIKF